MQGVLFAGANLPDTNYHNYGLRFSFPSLDIIRPTPVASVFSNFLSYS